MLMTSGIGGFSSPPVNSTKQSIGEMINFARGGFLLVKAGTLAGRSGEIGGVAVGMEASTTAGDRTMLALVLVSWACGDRAAARFCSIDLCGVVILCSCW